jgi:hypothetical protein
MAGNLQFKFFQCRLTFFFFPRRSQSGRVRYTRQKQTLNYILFLNVGYRDRMGRKVGRESWRDFCF